MGRWAAAESIVAAVQGLSALLGRLAVGGQRPYLTFVDGVTGERTELGYAAFENWTAKAAWFLSEEHEVATGMHVGLPASPHWTLAVAVVACWRAGATAVPGGSGHVDVPVEAHPFGWREVLAYPDEFDDAAEDGALEALPGVTRDAAAERPALADGARLLVTAPLHAVLVPALLHPLAVGGSVVVATNLDAAALDRLVEQERVTVRVA